MANSPNEPPAGAVPTVEEAERLAERFRPSWEVDAPLEEGEPAPEAVPPLPPGVAGHALTPPPPALVSPTPADVTSPPERAARKQTLLGIQPTDVAPGGSSPPAAGGVPKATLVGIGIPEVVRESAERSSRPPPLAPDEPRRENPLEDVFDVSEVAAEFPPPPPAPEPPAPSPPHDTVPEAPKPTGVAKLYHPKDGPDTPAVVVAPSALAEAPVRKPRARSRSQQTATIPGTLRALSGPATADSGAEEFAPRRSKLPLVIGVSLLLGVGAALAGVSLSSEPDEPPSLATSESPADAVQAAPAEIPPPPEVAPVPDAPAAAAASTGGDARSSDGADPLEESRARETPAASKAKEPLRKTTAAPVRKAAPPAAKKPAGSSKSKAVIVRESPF